MILPKNISSEREIKLKVKDIGRTLHKIRSLAKYINTEYIRDIVYGRSGDEKKIRLRISDNFEYQSINATRKYKVSVDDGIKKEIEEIIYKGTSVDDAFESISLHGDFKEENSYEKTRVLFEDDLETQITLDIYPFGSWVEVEGEVSKIHEIAEKLGFSKNDYINSSADDLYLEWIKKHNLPEMWDVRFGLNGDK